MPLTLDIPDCEMFDERTLEFINVKGCRLTLEHSLVSISKWEAKWHKPFLVDSERSSEEALDYIKFMTLTKNIDPLIYTSLSQEHLIAIREYIKTDQTATTFSGKSNRRGPREIMTSEVLYYQMFSLGIDKECEKWHLSRLLTLIRVFDVKNNGRANKMTPKQVAAQNKARNQARRAKYGTKG